jgi:oligoendopeptidase F
VIQQNFHAAGRYLAFQLALHEQAAAGRRLDREAICAAYLASFRELYGDLVILRPDGLGLLWARMPQHLRGFHSWEYMLGVACAATLAERFAAEPDAAAADLGELLRGGGSRPPAALLAGCKFRFTGTDLAAAGRLHAVLLDDSLRLSRQLGHPALANFDVSSSEHGGDR